ncbi:hypothetical protein CDG76_16340 [Nostoc sp. 'Peltigera membranacea cyanobiont' 210A]|nr:hypothetical protein CDG76_16340 [Nostoc sp. 'Peltigera membranacea cyanobiont' 210A]
MLTSKPRKPNPPSPPSLQGNGGFKASLRFGERFGEGFLVYFATFKTSFKNKRLFLSFQTLGQSYDKLTMLLL